MLNQVINPRIICNDKYIYDNDELNDLCLALSATGSINDSTL